MANRFYTLLIVPEKTSQVRRIVVPAWVVRGAALGLAFITLVSVVMLLDYWYVMNQIGENKQLKLENRKLKQQVQVFKNRMSTIEATLDRVKTFSTRLKVITNIQDRGNLLQSLNTEQLPDATSNVGNVAEVSPGTAKPVLATATTVTTATDTISTSNASPDDLLVKREYEEMENRCDLIHTEALFLEQTLQNQYELLADQKAFLAALPTRKPAVGYFTSGFGVRKSPFGGKSKMHEGLDIANRPGTPIKAPADGIVLFGAAKSGYGQTVILDHGYGLETWYGHIWKILVKKGQKVHRGDTIALLGNSGRSTGPHVHYEVRVHGTPVDPLSYILEN